MSDNYRRTADESAPIPVRWMALETLDDDVSTIMSVRWSCSGRFTAWAFGRTPKWLRPSTKATDLSSQSCAQTIFTR